MAKWSLINYSEDFYEEIQQARASEQRVSKRSRHYWLINRCVAFMRLCDGEFINAPDDQERRDHLQRWIDYFNSNAQIVENPFCKAALLYTACLAEGAVSGKWSAASWLRCAKIYVAIETIPQLEAHA